MKTNREVEGYLPLTPALFHVLLALADGGKHGYAILKDIEFRTQAEVRIGTGTLYGIIKRLLTEGLIEEFKKRPVMDRDDQRRIYYRLTPLGRQVAMAEAERHEKVLALARVKNVIPGPEPI